MELLQLAARVEQSSEHPLAQAIVRHAQMHQLPLAAPASFLAIPGQGVQAAVDGQNILVGTRRLLQENNIDFAAMLPEIEHLEQQGKTVMLITAGAALRGLIAVADTVKEDSAAAVADLQRLGLEVWMITGDNERAAGPSRPESASPRAGGSIAGAQGGKSRGPETGRQSRRHGGRRQSTMPRPSPPPTWASLSAPARTSPLRRPTSP
jgi:hypothetical protein